MSEYVQSNLNPKHRRVGDCVIRAISEALGQSWDDTYIGIVIKGFEKKDMPSGNAIWGDYLTDKGFTRHAIPAEYSGYSVADFAKDHPKGTFILAIDGHVVAVKDGNWYDSWDSRDEIPVYYWSKSV